MKLCLAWLLPLGLVLACQGTRPEPLDDAQLGIKIVFPGASQRARYVEKTPFGEIEFFGASYIVGGMGDSFQVQVGNLPRGSQGGATTDDMMATTQVWFSSRYPSLKATPLVASKGPGFRYESPGTRAGAVSGIVVFRRGRIHHAQVVAPEGNARAQAFLDSFQVN